jgi:hypothetical protein
MFFHLQGATLSTPTWAEFETASLLKIVSKDSIASTSAGEGSSLTKPPGSNFGNLKTRREEKDQSS